MDKNTSIKSSDKEIIESILQQKENFAFIPTPIHKLHNLSKFLDGPNIYIKRDDNTGLAIGGNKTRKLEYLIHEAIKDNCDVVITIGAPQSNHCRQTAAACAIYNLECYLILIGHENEMQDTGNILLDKLIGAKLFFYTNEEEAYKNVQILTDELKSKNRRPYLIPPGGSNATGLNGYINAYKEILEQEKNLNIKFDYLIFGSSSYGTHAGLEVGKKVFFQGERDNTKIYGISICKSFLDSTSKTTPEEKIVNLIQSYNQKYGTNIIIQPDEIILDQRFNELGYAVISEDDQLAINLFAKKEGIILDPVYSGRAAGAMIKMIKNKEIKKDENILFLHTGGSPAIFTDLFKLKLEEK
jgi:L-cysteate sulfo-lyase